MTRNLKSALCVLVALGILISLRTAAAQTSFTLPQVMSYPFPSALVASPTGSARAWVFTTRGVRNVRVAQGPDFRPRALTRATEEDDQEMANLSFTGDGAYVVYTRSSRNSSFPTTSTTS